MITELSERHPVDLLAEEFVARYRRGERPSISEYTQKYPELADKLQEILAALALIEEHAPARATSGESSGKRLRPALPAPQQLGEYSIIRELGRGGMGVVYEAVQQSLGRHVAIKVLPSYTLIDPLRLKRFQHEAQAAARLHHTNIVPVFGVGTEAGVHFYAMQFIQGRSLDEVLDELRRLKQSSNADKGTPEASAGAKDWASCHSNGQAPRARRACLRFRVVPAIITALHGSGRKWLTRWNMLIARELCIATSSPPICCSIKRERSGSRTLGWRAARAKRS